MTGSAYEKPSVLNRLFRHRLSMGGLLFIFAVTTTALLGYLIVPDSSPYANYQFPELALREPGLKVDVLAVPRSPEPKPVGFFHKMVLGQPPRFTFIPYQDLFIRDDSVMVVRSSEGKGDTIAVHLKVFTGQFHSSPTEVANEAQEEGFRDWVLDRHTKTKYFPLGTDRFGRCFLSRLVIGARVSLAVGLIAVIISLTIGLFLGAIAGYFGGKTDDVIMLLINAVWSIPTILLVFAIVLSLGRHAWNVYLAVGLTMWVDVARMVRGQVIDLKTKAFVEAARSMGFAKHRILIHHILPNTVGPLLVITAANFAMAILIEAGLSYLGFGIQPPQPSWGNLLNEHYGFALSGHVHLALIPAFCIMLLVLAFNVVGNGLRDAMDVKRK